MRPPGCGGGGPSASLRRLDDAHRHRLRRRALHTAPRRSQRGHLYFHHGLLWGHGGHFQFEDSMTLITEVTARDIRFPTSRALEGSDAMNPDPDYSAAYVEVRTDVEGLAG